jgi:hypothetical protein
MAIEEQVVLQIKSNIENIKTFDRNRFYPNGLNVAMWNNFSSDSLRRFVDDILDVFFSLLQKKDLEICGNQILTNIRDYSTNIINAYNGYLNIATNAVSSEHHQTLNYLEQLGIIIKSSGLYIDVKFDLKNESKELKSALDFAKLLNQNKPAYESSIEVFTEALKDKDKFTSAIINEKGELYNLAAKENSFFYTKKYSLKKEQPRQAFFRYFTNYIHFNGSFWQLLTSIIFAGITAYIVIDFIKLSESFTKLSTGFVLLRLSSLIIPSYFSLFFSQQYLNNKKLYEFYKFKGIALTTLSQLYTLYPNHQNQVIEKALGVIFSEFNNGENKVSQKELLSFAADIIKSKV